MHREDNSKYLLFIEPKASEKLEEPVNDDLTELMEMAISKAEEGISNYSNSSSDFYFRKSGGYRGSHTTDCGEKSGSKDLLLENGMITNSLAVFYVRWYRGSIPNTEKSKLNELFNFYKRI